MEAVTKHEFHATAEDELSFKKGTIIKVNESQKAFMCDRHFSISLRKIPEFALQLVSSTNN